MNKLVVFVLIGVATSAYARSYLSSKDKTCRSDCIRDEHCEPGFTCERVGCKFTCIRKVIPVEPPIIDSFPMEPPIVDRFPVKQPIVNLRPVESPVDRFPVEPPFLHVDPFPVKTVIENEYPLDIGPMRGDVISEHINKVVKGDGHFPNVEAANHPLSIGTEFVKDGGIIHPESGKISKIPLNKVLPVDQGFNFNEADRIFMCIENCVKTTNCIEGTDCVLGCRKLCQNGETMIDVIPEVPANFNGDFLPVGPIGKQMQGGNIVVGKNPLKDSSLHMPTKGINTIVDAPIVLGPGDGLHSGTHFGNGKINPIEPFENHGHINTGAVIPDIKVPIIPIGKDKIYLPAEHKALPVDPGFNMEPTFLDTTPMEHVHTTGLEPQIGDVPPFHVQPIDPYVPNAKSSFVPHLPKDIHPIDPLVHADKKSTGLLDAQFGNTGFPDNPQLNNDKAVIVDSNGQIQTVHNINKVIDNAPISAQPLIPVSPRNCYKECNRDFHCGPQRMCVDDGCGRICVPREDSVISKKKKTYY